MKIKDLPQDTIVNTLVVRITDEDYKLQAGYYTGTPQEVRIMNMQFLGDVDRSAEDGSQRLYPIHPDIMANMSWLEWDVVER